MMELKVIAYARNGHTDKFGIPRQSREASPIVTRIVFEPEYNVKEALRGIEGFSHLWIIWGFSENERKKDEDERKKDETERSKWSPTVRPPRLGGNKRVGVFATRSPFRPNPIGMSSVRLLKVERSLQVDSGKLKRLVLIVTGADMMDGTPIYDIKPYLSFSDSHPEAVCGYAEETKDYHLNVQWDNVQGTTEVPEEVMRDIEYILRQDPRPAYQDDSEREYKMDYGGWHVVFKVREGKVYVLKVESN